MGRIFKLFLNSHRQTKFFILMTAIYIIALAWTTLQAYARLGYSRSDFNPPIMIHIPPPVQK